jgi:hypothetical protein
MHTVIIEIYKMPFKKYLSGDDKELKQVRVSCRKLAIQIKKYIRTESMKQFLAWALSSLVTPLHCTSE